MALLQALISTGRQDGTQITGEETLAYPVHARYLKFYGAFANSVRLRLEVYGCVSDRYSQCTLSMNNNVPVDYCNVIAAMLVVFVDIKDSFLGNLY